MDVRQCQEVPMDAIPVLDLSPLRGDDEAAKRQLARRLDEVGREIGFFVVAGHGMDPALGERLYDAGRRFFDLPMAEKLKIRRPRDDQNRAYIPYGEETLVRMHGGDSPPDFKEVFAIGPFDVPDEPYYKAPKAYPSFAANLWPERPADLKPAMQAYWRGMEGVMRLMAEAAARALDLPPDWFADKLDRHTSQLRLLHYPALDRAPEPGQLRAGRHTDLGMMTVLRNDAKPGGLEVQSRDGRWIAPPAIPDTFVVNIGDMMMRWTNDRWVSTPHRVAVPAADAGPASRRLSVGFFCGPNYDAMVECLPGCSGPGNPAKYEPVSAHDYRTDRFAAGAGRKPRAA